MGLSVEHVINWTNPTNFTFDSALIEIDAVNYARLKTQLGGADEMSRALFDTSEDLDAGGGSLTAVLSGGAAASAGRLDLSGGVADKRAEWFAADSGDFTQVGTIRLHVVPNYTGTPTEDQMFFAIADSVGGKISAIEITHKKDGALRIRVRDTLEVTIVDAEATWTPTAGQAYELELNVDLPSSLTTLYVDGVQHVSTIATGTRGATVVMWSGAKDAGKPPDFFLEDFLIFNAVKHAAAYAGATGAATQYSTANPKATANAPATMDGFVGFTSAETTAGADAIKYTLDVDGQEKWWNGSAWANSDGTYSQSSTAADIHANGTAFDWSAGHATQIIAYLHSADGSSTPTVSKTTLEHDLYATQTFFRVCVVYGWLFNADGSPLVGEEVVIENSLFRHKDTIVKAGRTVVTSDGSGFWELLLQETETVGLYPYTFYLLGQTIGGVQGPNTTRRSIQTVLDNHRQS